MNAIQIAGMVVGGAGFVTIFLSLGWLPALGIFLALYGYGLQLSGAAQREAQCKAFDRFSAVRKDEPK